MRLRNIPGARDVIAGHEAVIKEEKQWKGRWDQVFENDHPIRLEIGMGKGQFLMQMALQNPDINYIGIERYSSVLLRALERMNALEEAPSNLRFVCMDASGIGEVFEKGEADRIYLNFSDPWPKARHAKRRLTSTAYWERYDGILKEDGTVEFKTDNRELFDFSLEEIRETGIFSLVSYTYDLHKDEVLSAGNVMTEYEEKFSAMGNPIFKLTASCNPAGNRSAGGSIE